MNAIEFFHYVPGGPLRRWGIRVDGTDLRARAAWATRELWGPELVEQLEEPEREVPEFLWHQHAGRDVEDFPASSFLTEAAAAPVLGCSCGVWECWPLEARIALTPTTVTWSSFRQPFRKQWGDLPIGPFVFDRDAYETALHAPPVLPHDPLGPPPPGLGP